MVVLWIALSVNSKQLRNIGRAKCIVCPTNPAVGRATALAAHYVPAPLKGQWGRALGLTLVLNTFSWLSKTIA